METKSTQPPYGFGTWTDEHGHVHHIVQPQGSKDKVNKIIDSYFQKLEAQLLPLVKEWKKVQNMKALVLKTVTDENLDFGEEIQEVSQIEVGTGPVRKDGAIATGEFTMPDSRILTIDEKGYVTKIKEPSTQEIADKIHQDIQAFKAELRTIIVRKPFKAKRQPSGTAAPYHKGHCK